MAGGGRAPRAAQVLAEPPYTGGAASPLGDRQPVRCPAACYDSCIEQQEVSTGEDNCRMHAPSSAKVPAACSGVGARCPSRRMPCPSDNSPWSRVPHTAAPSQPSCCMSPASPSAQCSRQHSSRQLGMQPFKTQRSADVHAARLVRSRLWWPPRLADHSEPARAAMEPVLPVRSGVWSAIMRRVVTFKMWCGRARSVFPQETHSRYEVLEQARYWWPRDFLF